MGKTADLGALVEGPDRIRAQGAEAHGRDIEYRCVIGPRGIRSANPDAERRGCERPRHYRMADPLEPLRIDVVLRPERALVEDHLGALIGHRPLVAAERPAVFLVFEEILTHLGSYLFEQKAQMGRDRIIAQHCVPRLDQIASAKNRKPGKYRERNRRKVDRSRIGQNGEQQRCSQQNAERVNNKAWRECETNHTHRVSPPLARSGKDATIETISRLIYSPTTRGIA